MPISSNKYVNITSGVGGTSAISAKEFKLRLITADESIEENETLTFTDADSVGKFFGFDSEEYARAAYYFGFISKSITRPKSIDFSRWATAETPPMIISGRMDPLDRIKSLATAIVGQSTAIGIDSFADLSLEAKAPDAVTYIKPVSLSARKIAVANSYEDVAAAVELHFNDPYNPTYNQTKNALELVFSEDMSNGGEEWSGSPELYMNGYYDTVIESIPTWTDLLKSLGLSPLPNSNYVSVGASYAQSPVKALSLLAESNNNFGSFDFIPDLSLDDKVAVAEWNAARNNEFMYLTSCSKSEAQAYYDALKGYSGTGVTVRADDVTDEYPELLPAAILASQNWDKPAASQNYMYQVDDRLTPSVTSTTEATALDLLRVNYMGQTQEAGKNIQFFQRGVLMGDNASPTAMGVYANEMWLKSYLKSQFLNMFLAMPQVPADTVGIAMGTSYIDVAVNKAIDNGSIATGKTLTNTQKLYITELSGDENAWRDVSGRGYWYAVDISEQTLDGITQMVMDYTLIYSKRDSVDHVSGRHILI